MKDEPPNENQLRQHINEQEIFSSVNSTIKNTVILIFKLLILYLRVKISGNLFYFCRFYLTIKTTALKMPKTRNLYSANKIYLQSLEGMGSVISL